MSIRPLRSCLYALKPIASVPRLAPLAVYSPRAATPTLWTRMFATSRRRDASGAKTFSNQNKLPRLPVPDLEKSLEGYVRSLIPVLEQTYGPNDLPKEIEKRKLFARDFASKGGMGRVLQERLRDLDHVSPNNWLDDTLWLPLAYHTWREPLLVNSNYWILFSPHPSDPLPPTHSAATDKPAIGNPDHNPSQAASSGSQGGGAEWIKANGAPAKGKSWDEAVSKEWITEYQVRKAAWVLSRFAQFRQMVADETLPPDASKAGPYCMSQYSKLFNFSRIPLPGTDAFSTIAPNATHATVIIDDFIYSIEVFEKPPSVDDVPAPLPLVVIEANIQAAVKDARKRLEAGEKAKAVGVLTADHRDTWARNREYLLSVSSENRAALESISTSLLALCLDPYTLPSLPTEDPLVNPTVDAQLRNGVGGIDGGRNRWYDKGVSIAVETHGRTSFSGEHSPIDALIPAITIEYVNGTPIDLAAFEGKSGGNGAFSRIDFVVDEQLEQEIKACAKRNQTILDDSDASQLWFGEYGVDWIKKHGKSGAKKEVDLKVDGFLAKISPDAYIQQALQLAWYKDQGYASATYETASTRAMKHGRTDVIRTLSVESRSFVKSMLDANSTDSTRYTALVEACKVHAELTRRSSSGHGWDRHLMGLRVMLRPGETHPLFEDDCYAKSQEWKLSTSGLSAGTKFTGTGFGTAFPNGLGTNYLAGAFLLKFGIETKWSCKETSTARFKHHLVQSLRDMRGVVESAGSVSAKL